MAWKRLLCGADESCRGKKQTNRPRHLPVCRAGSQNCPRCGANRPSCVRQPHSQPRRIVLHVEGETGESARISSGDEDVRKAAPCIGKRSETSSQLRRAGICCPADYGRLEKISFVVERKCHGTAQESQVAQVIRRAEKPQGRRQWRRAGR